jgi:hypothetical protein
MSVRAAKRAQAALPGRAAAIAVPT